MGLLCDYFTAASAAEAEETLDWIGGPSAPPSAKGLRRHRPTPAHPTVSLPGLEPTMWMGKLEEVLTGRSFDDILSDPSGKVVAIRDGGERVIVPVTSNLQSALLGLPDERVVEIATQWAEPDESYGTGTDPGVAAGALRDLLALVRAGSERGQALYCWVCV